MCVCCLGNIDFCFLRSFSCCPLLLLFQEVSGERRGRAKGVLEEAVLCGASAGDVSIDVISQSSAGPRAGAVFLEGLAVLPLSRRSFFDNVVVALVVSCFAAHSKEGQPLPARDVYCSASD